MNGNIYWLASYPKSGNTWVRVLLANYLSESAGPISINELASVPIASARQIFDDNVGAEASDLTHEEIERYRPGAYQIISHQSSEAFFMKVHDAFTRNRDGVPLFPRCATAGVIYIVRNPLDISISFAHHTNWSISSVIKKMADSSFSLDDFPCSLRSQLRQKLLSWSGHVCSWVDEPGQRLMVLRYEDLVADTAGSFRKMLHFCGIELDESKIARSVEYSTFSELRAQEKRTGFTEKMPLAQSFFREGRTDSWRTVLSAEQVVPIIENHGDVMQRFGYPIHGIKDIVENDCAAPPTPN